MLCGNFKDTSFTQTTYNFNAGVGFFMALIMINFSHMHHLQTGTGIYLE